MTDLMNIKGYIVTADIQKAFDSLDHDFLLATLEKFNFGKNFIEWIKIIITDQESCVFNGGSSTGYFPLQRGCRQGDPISAYLFILAFEVLLETIRANENIKGIPILEHVFKLSAYADDTTFFVNNTRSIEELFLTFNKFSCYSGLKLNASKSEICGIGAKKGDVVDLCGAKCLNLESEAIKILGVYFSYNKSLMDDKNFLTVITKIENTLFLWRKRSLTLEGRILVFKSLAFSKIIYISYLTDLPTSLINQLQSIQANFIWQGKKSKIRHVSLIGDYGDGGLKNVDIKSKMSSLRLAWIKRLFDKNFHPYKVIPLHMFSLLNSNGYFFFPNVNFSKKHFNYPKFYVNLLKEWTDIASKDPKLPSIALSEILWQNSRITINYKTIYFKDFSAKGINNVLHLFDSNGALYSWSVFQKKYDISDHLFLKWYQLCHAIPDDWKKMIKIDGGRCSHNVFPEQHFTFGGRMLSLAMLDSKTLYFIQMKNIFKAPTSQNNLDNLLDKKLSGLTYI